MTPLLDSQSSIVHGAGGSLGTGIAKTFAREGGEAEVAVLDALGLWTAGVYESSETAAFLASDRAGATTGTIVNGTCGLVPGG